MVLVLFCVVYCAGKSRVFRGLCWNAGYVVEKNLFYNTKKKLSNLKNGKQKLQ
jgi:hypothetical protein